MMHLVHGGGEVHGRVDLQVVLRGKEPRIVTVPCTSPQEAVERARDWMDTVSGDLMMLRIMRDGQCSSSVSVTPPTEGHAVGLPS